LEKIKPVLIPTLVELVKLKAHLAFVPLSTEELADRLGQSQQAASQHLKELEKLKGDMDAGKLKSGAYDQRLARVIQELRERGVDADRVRITAALVDAHQRGVITDSVKAHLEKRLGLV